MTQNYSSQELTPFPESGKVTEPRLISPYAAQCLYHRLRKDDEYSAQNRAVVQAMLDGEPPWSDAALKSSGAGFRFNLNFGEGAAMLDQALTSYNDLVDSVDVFVRTRLPYGTLDPVQQNEVEETIGEEWTLMVREENEFDFRWQILSTQFVAHGLSIGYFQDEFDWKFMSGGWDDFYIRRGTRATEEEVEVLVAERTYLPHQLYAFIKNEEAATQMGWDVDEVKRAIVCATKYSNGEAPPTWGADWALVQRQLKNNDLSTSYVGGSNIKALHFWVREYDGAYSHYISLRDSKVPEREDKAYERKFLYSRLRRYPNASSAFTIFTLGSGNGTYHSIRGLGYRIFPYIQVSNRLRCGVLDSTYLSTSLLLQMSDPGGLDEAPITVNGPLSYLSSEVNPVQRTFPNLADNALPILRDLQVNLQNNTPVYRARGVNPDRQARTKYEIQAQQELESTLSVATVNLFYRAWRRLCREMFRRTQEIVRKNLTGMFPEVGRLLQRLEQRGISKELFLMVSHVSEVRAVGLGSPGQRLLAYDDAMQMVTAMDEVGKKTLMRDRLASRFGRAGADRYMPPSLVQRPVVDQSIAELENASMFGGKAITPLDGQNHSIHSEIHLGGIMESVQVLEDWRNGGEQGDIANLQPHIEFLGLMVPHTERHVGALESDPTRAEEFGAKKKALQQLSAIWMTYVRELEKFLAEREEEAGAAEQPDPELLAKLQEHQMRLQMMQEKHALAQQLKVADVQSKLKLRAMQADQAMADRLRNAAPPPERELPPASAAGIISSRSLRP